LYVSLLVDEIYVNQTLTFKAQNIIGSIENRPTQIAKTVLSFMITSAFGSYKEIVKLVPVSGLTGEELKKFTIEVIQYVQSFNFKVIVVISDNNRVNQSMFKLFCETKYFTSNPSFTNLPLYLTYDFVHIFKNVRNNWLNIKNYESTFLYPDFDDHTIIRKASFDHLRQIHNNEKNILVKKAFKLNNKSLYPNNIERQNVRLVDNVFHYSTIAALKENCEYTETVSFMETIRKWWDIVNTKNSFKGIKKKKNEWSGPIYNVDDPKVQYLSKFVSWVKQWALLCDEKICIDLTKDTFSAIERSTEVLICLVTYSLENFPITYVLAGKFQTDNLEGRFGRSISGSFWL
jgi:hypothetical protein